MTLFSAALPALLLAGTLIGTPYRAEAQDFTLDPVEFDVCARNAPLEWEPVDDWPAGVDRYEIWAAEKSPASDWPGPAALIDSVDGNTTQFKFYADDGRQTCVHILAIGNGGADTLRSNDICFDLPILYNEVSMILDSASVTQDPAAPEGTVTLSWKIDPRDSTNLVKGQVFRAQNGGNFVLAGEFNPKSPPFVDFDAGAHLGPVTYRIIGYDDCEYESVSNTLTTIFLSGETNDAGENSLRWTPYDNDYLFDNLFYFLITEVVDGPVQQQDPQAVYPADVYAHEEIIDLTDPEQRLICYTVATAPRLLKQGEIYNATSSFSNRVCLAQTTPMFVPNAFAPNGVNQEFRPYGQFGNVERYSMHIFDRFGGLVFESKAMDTGWDGRRNGQMLPQGIYVYNIKLQKNDGEWIEKWGDVLLLR